MAIKLNRTLGAGVKQVHPTDKRGPKTHPSQSGTKKGPVHPVESLFLVQREDSNRSIGGSGITNHIPEKSHTVTNKTTRHTAGLTLIDKQMNYLKQTPHNGARRDLIVHTQKSDGAPITGVKPIPLFKRERDDTMPLTLR